MFWALYFNEDSENIAVYPELEEHEITKDQIEEYLHKNEDVSKWVIYDHMPTEEDIEEFENILDDSDSD